MSDDFKNGAVSGVGTSPVTVHTVPVGKVDVFLQIDLCNVTGTGIDVTVELWDDSASAFIALAKDFAIAANDTYQHLGKGQKLVLEENDYLRVTSSAAASLDVVTSFMEMTVALGSFAHLDNNDYLTGRNFADTYSVGLIKIDPADDTVINSDAGNDVVVQPAGTPQWKFKSTGSFVPVSDASQDVGGTGLAVGTIWAAAVNGDGNGIAFLDGVGVTRWSILPSTGNLQFGTAAGKIIASTSDGSDNQSLLLGAGGDANLTGTRGASIRMFGNEHASTGGLDLVAGNVSGSLLRLITQGSGQNIQFITGGSTNWEVIQSTGGLRYSSSAGQIYANSSDGTDNLGLSLSGGGAVNDGTRGAFLSLYGNEAGNTGLALLVAGNVSGGKVQLKTLGSQAVEVHTNGTLRWLVNSTGALVAEQSNNYILGATSDGSDNASLEISAAGNVDETRGSFIRLFGNEYVTGEGLLELIAGNTTSGNSVINLKANGSNGAVNLTINGSLRWKFNNSGHLIYSNNEAKLAASTSDGSDNARIDISGGGDASSSRGASVYVHGNEHASFPGTVYFQAGNVSPTSTAGCFLFERTGGTQFLKFLTGTNEGIQYTANGTNFQIVSSTSDGADSQSLLLCGGGASAASRGGAVLVFGNEYVSGEGFVHIRGGDTTSGVAGEVRINATSTAGRVTLWTANTDRHHVGPTGHFEPQSSGAYDLGIDTTNQFRTLYAQQIRNGNAIQDSGNITLSAVTNVVHSAGGSAVVFKTTGGGSTETWRFTSNDLQFSTSTALIKASTSDGSDTSVVVLCGGGSSAASRGAYIRVFGNDAGGGGNGLLELNAGDNSGSINLTTHHASGVIQFATNSTTRFGINTTALYPQVTATYDIGVNTNVLNRVWSNHLSSAAASTLSFEVDGTTYWYLDPSGGFFPNASGLSLGFNSTGAQIGTVNTNKVSAASGTNLEFHLNNLRKWFLEDGTGHILPDATLTYNIGSTSKAVNQMFVSTVKADSGGSLFLNSPTANVDLTTAAGTTIRAATNGTVTIGDSSGSSTRTHVVNCTPVTSTVGADTGNYLRLNINGTNYKIKLFADT